MNRILMLLTVVVAVVVAVGCAQLPQPQTSTPDAPQTEPSGDVSSEFLSTEDQVQVFGYGPTESGNGAASYFMLHVAYLADTDECIPWSTQITEQQMGWVIQNMTAKNFFRMPRQPTPERSVWRLVMQGPPGRVERYCTKDEFDIVVESINEVLPSRFKMKGK